MHVVRFTNGADQLARYGILEGDVIREIEGSPFGEVRRTGASCGAGNVTMLAPCAPGKIVAGGANYHGHLREMNLAHPSVPVFFLKAPSAIIGHNDSIEYPPESRRLEYEGELGVIVKRKMRRIEPDEVSACILGYTCVNDVTARDINMWGGNFLHLCHAKSFDTFCPVGPWITTDIDPGKLGVKLTVNGGTRQDSNTGDMIFSITKMISYFSQVMTLNPGDLILTGSPEGTGRLEVGDIVELTIENIGTLRNKVIASQINRGAVLNER